MVSTRQIFKILKHPPILLSAIWVVVIYTVSLMGLNLIDPGNDTAYTWISPESANVPHTWSLSDLVARWDAFYYFDIAENGYSFTPGQQSNIAFFPVYPGLMALLSVVFGSAVWSAIFISTLATIASAQLMVSYIKQAHPDLDAYRSTIYLYLFPTAVFLTGAYTEAIFLSLSLVMFTLAKNQRLWLAGLVGAAAALTRSVGFILFVPLAIEILEQSKWRITWHSAQRLAPALMVPAATAAVFLYHLIAFGDFFAFLDVQSAWGRDFSPNADHFDLKTWRAWSNFAYDLSFIIIAITAAVICWRRKWFSYAGYIAAGLAVPLSSGTMMSIGRYVLVLFPVFIALSTIENRWFRIVYLSFSSLSLLLYTVYLANGFWAG